MQLPGAGVAGPGGTLLGEDQEAEIQEIKQNPPAGMEHVISRLTSPKWAELIARQLGS